MNVGVQIVVATLPIFMALVMKVCQVAAFGTLVWYARDATGKLRTFLLTLSIIGGVAMAFGSLNVVDVVQAAYPKLNAERLR